MAVKRDGRIGGGYIFCCWFAMVVIMVIMSREQGAERQR
jgi:hypothetical protein